MNIQAPPPIFSKEFEDTYFSKQNGIEETRHVFLGGNRLPERWAERKRFVIGETGFGTGLNFLTCWEMFEKTARPGQCLDYISAELYPLSASFLKRFLIPLFGERAKRLIAQYPLYPTPGFHRLELSPHVSLTLIFDDVCTAFEQVTTPVDAWFLDGFVPANNPGMWRPELFRLMADLSAPEATLATFTAAGFVRRALARAGFDIRKTKGFGTKRDMTVGRISGPGNLSSLQAGNPGKIAVIGGGLAGSAAAWHLKQRGHAPVVYDKAPAPAAGASGNVTGLFNPRPYAMRHERNEYHCAGLALIARIARRLEEQGEEIDLRLPGCLHITRGPKKMERHLKACSGMGWPDDLLKMVSPGQASAIAGIEIDSPCLYSPLAGALSPPKLVEAYLKHIEFVPESEVAELVAQDSGWALMDTQGKLLGRADQVILTRPIPIRGRELDWPSILRPVQGQVTQIRACGGLEKLRCNIGHGGYLCRIRDLNLLIGATFHRGRRDGKESAQDDYRNFHQLRAALPGLLLRPDFISRRASVRLTTPDHMPLVGKVPGSQGLYISAGWGSHGILGTAIGGAMLSDELCGRAEPIPKIGRAGLDPIRFLTNTNK